MVPTLNNLLHQWHLTHAAKLCPVRRIETWLLLFLGWESYLYTTSSITEHSTPADHESNLILPVLC